MGTHPIAPNLPALNAALNSTSAILLSAGLIFIKRKNIRAHKICMLSAFFVSCVFLASYLIYHAHAGAVYFKGAGWIRRTYLSILFTHTVLAASVAPLAVITIRRALYGDIARHRKIAVFTLPVWLYVSITGVIVYWMLFRS